MLVKSYSVTSSFGEQVGEHLVYILSCICSAIPKNKEQPAVKSQYNVFDAHSNSMKTTVGYLALPAFWNTEMSSTWYGWVTFKIMDEAICYNNNDNDDDADDDDDWNNYNHGDDVDSLIFCDVSTYHFI